MGVDDVGKLGHGEDTGNNYVDSKPDVGGLGCFLDSVLSGLDTPAFDRRMPVLPYVQ